SFVTFNANVALHGRDANVWLVTVQLDIDPARHLDIQIDFGHVIVILPAEPAIDGHLGIAHVDGYSVSRIVELNLSVLHPEFAAAFAAAESLHGVDRHLAGIGAGDVDGPFVILDA